MSLDQILLIDKPTGMTSFGVVARARRKLTTEAGHKVKTGHTGTLDPFATGLMLILTGKMTKQAEEYSKLDKTYEATIYLGATSTTGDPEGEINQKKVDMIPTKKQAESAVKTFVGEIIQTPPIYSAIKIDGQRAYKLARKGVEIEIPKRKVTIFSLELISYSYPELKIRTHVSSGTYIRSLAVDIGRKLGTGAYVTELRRTRVGKYDIKDALPLADYMSI